MNIFNLKTLGVTSFSGGLVALRDSVISLRGAMLGLSAVNPVFAGLAIVVAGATYARHNLKVVSNSNT